MARVAPSERFRRELDDVLAGVDGEADPLERIGRLGARLILQQALEDEVSEFLGRARYERAIDPVGHRNGYEPRRVVTTAGPVWKSYQPLAAGSLITWVRVGATVSTLRPLTPAVLLLPATSKRVQETP